MLPFLKNFCIYVLPFLKGLRNFEKKKEVYKHPEQRSVRERETRREREGEQREKGEREREGEERNRVV